MKSILKQLSDAGQSIWYDNISRTLLVSGQLAGMIERGEIRGVTSNPSIFNKAISQSEFYREDIARFAALGQDRMRVYEALAVDDIQAAADLFLPLYQETDGGDGYVSLEVSPYLARDTRETILEAQRLWEKVDRPNLMIKIPGTKEGLPAVREVIAAGINVNVTLLFGIPRYREVMQAYMAGLGDRLAAGKSITRIASVASFFISRIETKADQRIRSLIKGSGEKQQPARELIGRIAVASGKLAYEAYQEVFSPQNQHWLRLSTEGARVQRLLWASTSTKDEAYSDVKYVEELIGPGTINTMPPATLEAFLDHGQVKRTVDDHLPDAYQAMEDLASLGIDINLITRELVDEGVASFANSFTELLDTIEDQLG